MRRAPLPPCYSRASLARRSPAAAGRGGPSTLAGQVDDRRRLGVRPEYLGHLLADQREMRSDLLRLLAQHLLEAPGAVRGSTCAGGRGAVAAAAACRRVLRGSTAQDLSAISPAPGVVRGLPLPLHADRLLALALRLGLLVGCVPRGPTALHARPTDRRLPRLGQTVLWHGMAAPLGRLRCERAGSVLAGWAMVRGASLGFGGVRRGAICGGAVLRCAGELVGKLVKVGIHLPPPLALALQLEEVDHRRAEGGVRRPADLLQDGRVLEPLLQFAVAAVLERPAAVASLLEGLGHCSPELRNLKFHIRLLNQPLLPGLYPLRDRQTRRKALRGFDCFLNAISNRPFVALHAKARYSQESVSHNLSSFSNTGTRELVVAVEHNDV
mmetsp:Transcript_19331/g.46092  ORF Transcript_19331/g.46092 Transcript_19331/m.46092 type:complete len:383 (+) Transcript_19331:440-1588(+)